MARDGGSAMIAQPELDFAGVARCRGSDPVTARRAARSVQGEQATRMEAMILDALRDHADGLTSHELAEVTGLSLVSASPRLRPLVNKGLVMDSGVKRAGPSGRGSIVWRVVA